MLENTRMTRASPRARGERILKQPLFLDISLSFRLKTISLYITPY